VAGCIIAKLPSSWRNLVTILKHKRQKISVDNLIVTLDVEEKARKINVPEKGDQVQSNANMAQKFSRGKNKGNNKPNKSNMLEYCMLCFILIMFNLVWNLTYSYLFFIIINVTLPVM